MHAMYTLLPLLILFSPCRAGFNSDGSNEGASYRDTVKVKRSHKRSWDTQRLAEWEALTFPRPEGLRAWNSVTTAQWEAGAMERGPSVGAVDMGGSATAKPQCWSREGTGNKHPKLSLLLPSNLQQVSLIGQTQPEVSQPPRMVR